MLKRTKKPETNKQNNHIILIYFFLFRSFFLTAYKTFFSFFWFGLLALAHNGTYNRLIDRFSFGYTIIMSMDFLNSSRMSNEKEHQIRNKKTFMFKYVCPLFFFIILFRFI